MTSQLRTIELVVRIFLYTFATFILYTISTTFQHLKYFDIAVYVFIAIALLMIWREYLKIKTYQTRAKMAHSPDTFSPDKLDCFVRFKGTLVNTNDYTLPLSNRACAMYQAGVFAEWQTKRKSPQKGMELHRKPLFIAQNPEELEIKNGAQRVFVKTADFPIDRWHLHHIEHAQSQCPDLVSEKAQNKYKTYRSIENYAKNGDTVTLQGRLIRHSDGRLFIEPTLLLQFPSFFAVQTQTSSATQFADTIVDSARKDIIIRRLNMAALALNALILLFICIV